MSEESIISLKGVNYEVAPRNVNLIEGVVFNTFFFGN